MCTVTGLLVYKCYFKGFSEAIGPNRTYSNSPLRFVDTIVEDFKKCEDAYWEKNVQILVNGQQFCVCLRNDTKHNTNKGCPYITYC